MPTRSQSPRPRRLTPGPPSQQFQASPLELISDEEGSVAIGWVAPDVLYARMMGGLSADVGRAQAARIRGFADASHSLDFFVDASRVTYYDLLARSAFVRAVLEHRRRFRALVLLTFAKNTTPAETSFVEVVGPPLDLMRNPDDFEDRLLDSAPFARRSIESAHTQALRHR